MKIKHYMGLLSLTFAAISAMAEGGKKELDLRDREVLEVLLLHLLADGEFKPAMTTKPAKTIFLHDRTPEFVGFIHPRNFSLYIGDSVLPDDAVKNLQARNLKPDTFEPIGASFPKEGFAPEIRVTDLSGFGGGVRAFVSFREEHPSARAWVKSFLPGYSQDGDRSVISAEVGPSSHGAHLTALLHKENDEWKVKWYHVHWFL